MSLTNHAWQLSISIQKEKYNIYSKRVSITFWHLINDGCKNKNIVYHSGRRTSNPCLEQVGIQNEEVDNFRHVDGILYLGKKILNHKKFNIQL